MSDKAFVDSNLWLYAFALRPGEEVRHERAKVLIEAPVRYTISEQVIAEVSNNLLKKAQMKEDRLLAIIESFYVRCQVVAPDIARHRHASRGWTLAPSLPLQLLGQPDRRSRTGNRVLDPLLGRHAT
jgi:predicted nucleic acid-binding protein